MVYVPFSPETNYQETTLASFFRILMSITTVITIIFIVLRSLKSFRQLKVKGKATMDDPFVKSRLFKYMLLEIFINLIHVYPGCV